MLEDFKIVRLKDTTEMCVLAIEEKYPEENVDRESVRITLRNYLVDNSKGAFLYTKEDKVKGILAYSISPKIYNYGEKILSEDFLLIHPDNKSGTIGLRLINIFLKGAESLKKDLNISDIQVVFPNDENTSRIEKFYNKKNFNIVEVLAERKENVL